MRGEFFRPSWAITDGSVQMMYRPVGELGTIASVAVGSGPLRRPVAWWNRICQGMKIRCGRYSSCYKWPLTSRTACHDRLPILNLQVKRAEPRIGRMDTNRSGIWLETPFLEVPHQASLRRDERPGKFVFFVRFVVGCFPLEPLNTPDPIVLKERYDVRIAIRRTCAIHAWPRTAQSGAAGVPSSGARICRNGDALHPKAPGLSKGANS